MVLQYFVTDAESCVKIPVEIDKSTAADLAATKNNWQTDWTSEFIGDPVLEKYTAKQNPVRSLHWVLTGKQNPVCLYISNISKAIRRAIQR